MKTIFTLIIFSFISLMSFSQKMGFDELLTEKPDELTVFCIPNNDHNFETLQKDGIKVKFSSSNWIFINASPAWIDENHRNGSITDYYFEFAPPVALADTARAWHYVNQVHQGMAPIGVGYTGQDVIFGVVDQGIDWTHPDFIDSNGNTRVLRYWDHSMTVGSNIHPYYGYGQLWDSTDINNAVCTSTEEASAHGTSVTGIGTGNGSANGSNMGMAPNADIVVVETNFNLPNWTLTIADAVDYIFKVADSLNKPAVVNLSLGSYYGSHDGNDPAAEAIETLLDAKPGRIVICAAGNSGAQGDYHQQSTVTSDTNFVWFTNNPTGALGNNTIFFDVWSDQADANYNFAVGADTPGPSYSFRGRTGFWDCFTSIGSTIYDTIWNNGNRIATIEAYREIVGSNFHLQVFVSNVDSTSYNYRFETTGTGQYDLWSGAWAGYNDMVTTLPTIAEMPAIAYYVLPDNSQTVVSSWNCSEKVVSVGNMRNRQGHIDKNGNPYINLATVPGDISPNSSTGPNRHNVIKPDVSAAGDVSLGAGPLWVLTTPAYYPLVDSGGWHVRNGGTSMASPVVTGIAALYLERCRYADYSSFMLDLKNTCYTDGFTGSVPNNTFGFGKPDAFSLLQELTLETQPTVSFNSGSTILSSSAGAYQWILDGNEIQGETNQQLTPQAPYGTYQVMTINSDGCYAVSDPLVITAGLDEENNSMKIYPNPTLDEFKIESENEISRVVAKDMNGKEVELKEISEGKYSLKELETGNYILMIYTDQQIVLAKIIHM